MDKPETLLSRGDAVCNQRYSDFSIRLPREYNFLEETVRRIATSRVRRGRVEISVTIEDFREKARTVKIDWGLLQGFDRAISEVAQRLELEPTNRVDFLLSLPGVLEPVAVDEEDEELLQSLVEAAAQEAVELWWKCGRLRGRGWLLPYWSTLRSWRRSSGSQSTGRIAPQEAWPAWKPGLLSLRGYAIDPNRLAAEAPL